MKKIFKHIEFIFDYYIAYFLYNGNKIHRYEQYMKNKYGESIK